MCEIIKNRSEILFLYDVTDANPNGDPVEENRPRIDEETGQNVVTDVRLKRTIRDYLHDFKGEEILVREIRDENGFLQDAKMRAEDFLVNEEGRKLKKGEEVKTVQEMERIIRQNVLKHCVDVRLFGVTLPFELERNKAGSVTITGPVQFKLGRSLHRVEMTYIKGTGAFASQPGKEQFTFREEYILPYSLIAFYGIVNENAAQISQMTERDLRLLLDGLWNGTKNLISRTKAGQMPRLLLQVRYKEENYHIGELDRRIKLVSNKRDEEIRDISEVQLDVTELARALESNRDKIDKISYAVDERLSLVKDGNPIKKVEKLVEGIKYEQLRF
jgi:CRISPR-associated protein Csh2